MNAWRDLLVTKKISIEDAIILLNDTSQGILLVVDDNEVLEGTITDGDIRRALLMHKTMQCLVVEVMNVTPKVAYEHWSEQQVHQVMSINSLLHMPIVDETMKVKGLKTLKELVEKKRLSNPVFLMAGGFGKRLMPLTKNCPKPMLKIDSKPILEHIIRRFIDAGFYRFYISTHYMPEVIKNHFGDGGKWNVEINYVHENEPLGTGGAIGLLPKNEINDPMFMINGDVLSDVDLLSFLKYHSEQNRLATIGVRKYEYQVPFGVITADGNKIESLIEKPTYSFFVNAGIYILSPDLVKSIPYNTKIDMPSLLEKKIELGNDVSMFPLHESWLDVGRAEDFELALTN